MLQLVTEPIPNPDMFAIALDFAGMSKKQLAAATGISARLISKYYFGQAVIPAAHVGLIATALDRLPAFFYRKGEYLSPLYKKPVKEKPLRQQCHEIIDRLPDDLLLDALEGLQPVAAELDNELLAKFRSKAIA